ncbi:MAG: YHYH protein [Gemmatimonadetes bacterium]|nr:YHYH protein [Gemmatimonadota bacterium]
MPLAGLAALVLACSQAATTPSATSIDANLPAPWKKFTANSGVVATLEGTTVVVRSTAIPDHKSPYFGAGDARYEAYTGTNGAFAINPNRIGTQSLTFRIPVAPTAAATVTATPLGPIGVALNGVPFFNQYAGPNQPLTGEINSFDQYNGHPQMSSMYHYHVEPLSLTARLGREGLLGFLLDGFPLYGPLENGIAVAEAGLDAQHGHTHATADYPAGTYHYHVTAIAPYINGAGFRGTPGTVSQ